jgi:hypothetical protein
LALFFKLDEGVDQGRLHLERERHRGARAAHFERLHDRGELRLLAGVQLGHRHEALEHVAQVLGRLVVRASARSRPLMPAPTWLERAEPLHGGQVLGERLRQRRVAGQRVHAADGPHVRRALEVADQVDHFLVVADAAAAARLCSMAARMVALSPRAIRPGSRNATTGRGRRAGGGGRDVASWSGRSTRSSPLFALGGSRTERCDGPDGLDECRRGWVASASSGPGRSGRGGGPTAGRAAVGGRVRRHPRHDVVDVLLDVDAGFALELFLALGCRPSGGSVRIFWRNSEFMTS